MMAPSGEIVIQVVRAKRSCETVRAQNGTDVLLQALLYRREDGGTKEVVSRDTGGLVNW